MPSYLSRVLRVLLALAVLLVVAFFAGGGWYFAGQIDDGALAVTHAPERDTLRLTPGQDGTTVALLRRSAEVSRIVDSDQTYGVEWAGGYGQLTGPARPGPDGAVVRDLRVLVGTRPTAGTPAHLDRSAFPADPRRVLGASAQSITYLVGGTEVPAWFAPGLGGNTAGTWVVLVHGKGATRAEMLRPMRDVVATGLPALAISYRNDVGAPADPHHRYGYGRTEWPDLAAAVRYAAGRGADQVVLVGASMGGGIIASYLEHRPQASLPVAGVVLDAPMLDLAATVQYGARQRPLPVLGHVPDALTWVAERIATMRFGVHWGAVDYLDSSAWLTMPALVLHGGDDLTVPLATSERLRAEHPHLVQLLVTPHADHVESWNEDPAAYDRAVRAFLRRVA